ncbi:hypothetical protein Tco_0843717 [Tanacetum coccineum]
MQQKDSKNSFGKEERLIPGSREWRQLRDLQQHLLGNLDGSRVSGYGSVCGAQLCVKIRVDRAETERGSYLVQLKKERADCNPMQSGRVEERSSSSSWSNGIKEERRKQAATFDHSG